MKLIALIFLLLLGACASNSKPDQTSLSMPDSASIERPDNPEAARLLDEFLDLMDTRIPVVDSIAILAARDRYARQVFIEMFSDPDLDPDVRTAFQETGGRYIEQIDTINTKQLKIVLEEINWRDLAERENNAFELARRIVQHSNDDDFQASVLQEIEPLAEEGLIDGQQYALMYDRVQLKKNNTQRYGSQTRCVNGQYDVYGLIEPDSVDQRREALGMEPLATYLERNRSLYGPCSE